MDGRLVSLLSLFKKQYDESSEREFNLDVQAFDSNSSFNVDLLERVEKLLFFSTATAATLSNSELDEQQMLRVLLKLVNADHSVLRNRALKLLFRYFNKTNETFSAARQVT